jgi:hypothetical protein
MSHREGDKSTTSAYRRIHRVRRYRGMGRAPQTVSSVQPSELNSSARSGASLTERTRRVEAWRRGVAQHRVSLAAVVDLVLEQVQQPVHLVLRLLSSGNGAAGLTGPGGGPEHATLHCIHIEVVDDQMWFGIARRLGKKPARRAVNSSNDRAAQAVSRGWFAQASLSDSAE